MVLVRVSGFSCGLKSLRILNLTCSLIMINISVKFKLFKLKIDREMIKNSTPAFSIGFVLRKDFVAYNSKRVVSVSTSITPLMLV